MHSAHMLPTCMIAAADNAAHLKDRAGKLDIERIATHDQ